LFARKATLTPVEGGDAVDETARDGGAGAPLKIKYQNYPLFGCGTVDKHNWQKVS